MLHTSVKFDLKRDLRAAREIHLPVWVLLLAGVGAALIAILLDHYGKIVFALPVYNSLVVFSYLIALRWGLRMRIWFWVALTIFAILHVPLILLIPWTNKWVPPFAIATLDTVDFCTILWLLSVLGRFMKEPRACKNEGVRPSAGN
jgi:hypothetical protein